jgi:hypothetical protein
MADTKPVMTDYKEIIDDTHVTITFNLDGVPQSYTFPKDVNRFYWPQEDNKQNKIEE